MYGSEKVKIFEIHVLIYYGWRLHKTAILTTVSQCV